MSCPSRRSCFSGNFPFRALAGLALITLLVACAGSSETGEPQGESTAHVEAERCTGGNRTSCTDTCGATPFGCRFGIATAKCVAYLSCKERCANYCPPDLGGEGTEPVREAGTDERPTPAPSGDPASLTPEPLPSACTEDCTGE